jgi:hypothetical protein
LRKSAKKCKDFEQSAKFFEKALDMQGFQESAKFLSKAQSFERSLRSAKIMNKAQRCWAKREKRKKF